MWSGGSCEAQESAGGVVRGDSDLTRVSYRRINHVSGSRVGLYLILGPARP